jgi:hypothetical protein
MADLPDLSELRIRGEEERFQFLQTDLDLCLTFVEVAKTELLMNDREGVQSALDKAETGYATIERLLGRLEKVEHQTEIERKLNHLRTVLDAVHRQASTSTDQHTRSA